MATEYKFPDLGEGVTEGEIKKWLVKEGDTVAKDQALAEVETDKAVVEMPSPVAGTVLKMDHKEGDLVKVGEVLVVIGEKGEATAAKAEGAPTKTEKPSEESRPSAEAPAPTAGTEAKPERPSEEEETIVFGGRRTAHREVTVSSTGRVGGSLAEAVQATPAVRKLAKDMGVDISTVKGDRHQRPGHRRGRQEGQGIAPAEGRRRPISRPRPSSTCTVGWTGCR